MSKVKICGLKTIEDIEAVNQTLPDFIGFVFAESKRKIGVKRAADLKKRLDPKITAVGVFVNQEIDFIIELYQRRVIDLVQLHGEENTEYIQKLKKRGIHSIIKAVGIKDTLPVLPKKVDYLLFDKLSKESGGTGKKFDWNCLLDYHQKPYFLAGGLDAHNVVDGIQMLSPFCVDVSSGVETDGKKDPEKIKDFINLVRRHGN